MYKNKLKLFITLIFCLVTSVAFAETPLPNHYPTGFDVSGVVTNIDRVQKIIWIDGAQYKLHPIHDIYTQQRGSSILLYSLKKGMKLGGEFSTYKNQRVFTKMWIVPEEFPSMTMEV